MDLNGGSMFRRTTLSPRVKATVVVASPRCIRNREHNNERKMGMGKVSSWRSQVKEVYNRGWRFTVPVENAAEDKDLTFMKCCLWFGRRRRRRMSLSQRGNEVQTVDRCPPLTIPPSPSLLIPD
jgi:hypothetical protein